MRALLQSITEALWPAHPHAPGGSTNANAYLKPLAILMIGFIAGPDFFAAMELTTLLELLGAALFLLTFAFAFRALGLSALQVLRNLLLPAEYVALIRMRRKPSAVFHGVSLVCRNVVFFYCMGLVACAWICSLAQLVS